VVSAELWLCECVLKNLVLGNHFGSRDSSGLHFDRFTILTGPRDEHAVATLQNGGHLNSFLKTGKARN
jgi:hypothetical protein